MVLRVLSGLANTMDSPVLKRRVQKLEQGAFALGDSCGEKGTPERAV